MLMSSISMNYLSHRNGPLLLIIYIYNAYCMYWSMISLRKVYILDNMRSYGVPLEAYAGLIISKVDRPTLLNLNVWIERYFWSNIRKL